MTPIEKAIKLAGGASALAEKIGVASSQVVSNWKYRGKAPPEYCVAIERATDGEVTRHQLRPDIFGPAPAAEAARAA